MTTVIPARPPVLRRCWRWLAAGALVVGLGTWCWLAWQMRPKQAELMARRSPFLAAETEPERAENGGYLSQAVRVRARSGLTVDLRVLRPAGEPGPLPLMVLLGGHRTGRDAVKLLGAPGPFVVAALDYPYDGPERPRGLWQSLRTIPAARQTLLDTPAAVLLAIEWLEAQPWVDPGRMEIVGVSFGVPFATVVAAMEPRLRRVWLIHGGSGNRAWIEQNLVDDVGSPMLRRPLSGFVWLLTHGPTLDAGHWVARIAPRPVVVIGARSDQRLPPELVDRLHAAAGEPKELVWMDGGHIDRRPEAVQHLLGIVRSRMGGEGGTAAAAVPPIPR